MFLALLRERERERERERGSNTRSPKFLIPMYLAWFRV
jgi:hypothetical protein